MYVCILALVCLNYMYVVPLFVYSTPFADRECACVDEVACSIYIYIYVYWCLYVHMYIGASASELHICIATIRPLNSACRVGVWLCGRSCVFDVHIYTSMEIVPTVYTYCRYLTYVYVSDIYARIYTDTLPLFVIVHTNGLEMWIWANVTSVGVAGTAFKRDERKARFS